MKIIYIFFALFLVTVKLSYAQDDVDKALADASKAYDDKNLQDARFALEQSLQAIDVVIGKDTPFFERPGLFGIESIRLQC